MNMTRNRNSARLVPQYAEGEEFFADVAMCSADSTAKTGGHETLNAIHDHFSLMTKGSSD
jgi:hypothetical protein